MLSVTIEIQNLYLYIKCWMYIFKIRFRFKAWVERGNFNAIKPLNNFIATKAIYSINESFCYINLLIHYFDWVFNFFLNDMVCYCFYNRN